MHAFDRRKQEEYKAEAREKWGGTDPYREYEEKTKDDPGRGQDDLAAETDRIMAEFALCMKSGNAPDSAGAQSLVKRLQDHMTEHYYRCTDEILAGLGRMYSADERFQANIDQHADGTAAFLSEAIEVYCRG